MWSILYECEGTVYKIGPFKAEQEAMSAAKKAQADKEFDINDQRVYLLSPNHNMTELSMEDVQ